jgi:hyperosmotically inducible protein
MNNSRHWRNSIFGIGATVLVSAGVGALAATAPSGASTDSSASVGAAISDTAITTEVKGKIATDSRLKGSDIHMKTNNGVVTMTGTTTDSTAKDAAEELARNVSGVRSVNDQMTSSSSEAASLRTKAKHATHATAEAITDTTITAKLKTRYATDGKAKGASVDVTTDNGIVSLSGSVVSQGQKNHVVAVAEHTKGVKQVDSTALKISGEQ